MQGPARFAITRIDRQMVRQPGAAEVQIGPAAVVWEFDDAKLAESPASTPVICVDEYAGKRLGTTPVIARDSQ